MRTEINKDNKTVDIIDDSVNKKRYTEEQLDTQIAYMTESIRNFNEKRKFFLKLKKDLKNA